jgi:phosphate transport system substrate-binding protein
MVKRRKWALVGLFASLAIVAAACGGDEDEGNSGTNPTLSGNVVVSGSSTVLPISTRVAEKFNANNPDVNISVDGPGTGDGFELFCNGEIDISDASRPIEEEEVKACEKGGIEYIELEIALDGVTVMTNPANDAITCLNLGDLYALVGPESEGFSSWADANALAKKVGGTDSFPDMPLDITAPGEESGTYDAFIELAGFEDTGVSQGLSEDKAATTRPDYQASADDNVIIQGIEGSDSSFGWVGFAYAQQAGEGVKEIEIDGGDGCVAPSDETIADGTYPLSRSLYIYVNKANIAENPAVKAYVDSYLSDDGIASVTEVGYVPLPSERLEATRSTWSGA